MNGARAMVRWVMLMLASHVCAQGLLENPDFSGCRQGAPGAHWRLDVWGDIGGKHAIDGDTEDVNRIDITRFGQGIFGYVHAPVFIEPGEYLLRIHYRSEIPLQFELKPDAHKKDLFGRVVRIAASPAWRIHERILTIRSTAPRAEARLYGRSPGSFWMKSMDILPITPSDFAPVMLSIDAQAARGRISEGLFGMHVYASGYRKDKNGQRRPVWSENMKRLCRDAGITHIRVYLYTLFRCIEGEPDYIAPGPDGPRFHHHADAFLKMLEDDMGIEVIPILALYCPQWLSTRRPSSLPFNKFLLMHRAPPKDNDVFADMMAGLIRHWKEDVKLKFTMIQIGNEPNNDKKYWVGGTADEFGRYFQTIARAIRREYPEMIISGPCLAGGVEQRPGWLDTFLPYGRGGLLSNVSWNVYKYLDVADNVRFVRKALREAGYGSRAETMPLWISEYNYRASGAGGALDTLDAGVHVARFLRNAALAGVQRATLFCAGGATESMGHDRGPDRSMNMLYHERPRPGYYMFKAFARDFGFSGAERLDVRGEDPRRIVALACRDRAGLSIAVIGLNAMARGGVRIALKNAPHTASVYHFTLNGFRKESDRMRVGDFLDIDMDGLGVKMIRLHEMAGVPRP